MADWWQSDPVAAPASAPAASWWGSDPVAQPAAAPASPGDQGANAAFDNATLHGLPVVGPMIFGGLDHVVAGARSAWKGTPYADELATVRAQRDAIEQPMQAEHPIATTAGGVAGGVAGTGLLVAAAPEAFGVGAGGMLARTGMSALSGAALNGADAAVRSGGDLGATAWGAALGAGTGALTPVVGRGLGAIFAPATDPALASMPSGARNFATSTFSDPAKAAAIQSDLGRLGPMGTLADVSPTWMGVAQGASAQPAGREAVISALVGRDAGKNVRLASDLDSSLGAPVVPSQVVSQLEASQKALAPQYAAALNGAKAVDSTPLADALDTQAVNLRGPAQAAVQKVRGYLNIPGTQTLDPNPGALFQTRNAIDGLMAGETNPKVIAQLQDARGQVDGLLAKAAPGIKDVDAQFQQLALQKEGLQSGSTIFDTGKTAPRPAEVQTALDSAVQPNGTLIGPSAVPMQMRQGARAELDRIAGQNINDPAALQRAVKGDGDWPRQNTSILFGSDKADQALNAIDREAQFFRTKNDVVGNSNTALRQEFGKAMDAAGKPMDIPPNLSLIGIAGAGANKVMTAMRAGAAQRAGGRFASSLGNASVASGSARDDMVRALMGVAARGANANDLSPGAQAVMRALVQSGARAGSGYLAHTPQR